jgi:translation initiation factor 5B
MVGGQITNSVTLMREDGAVIGTVKGVQMSGENVGSASVGKEVAVSIDGPTVGRQIHEGDILYVNIPERHVKIIEAELKQRFSEDELEALEKFLEIKRSKDPFWGR